MLRITKILTILSAIAAISFAQVADTSKQVQEPKQIQTEGTFVSSNQPINLPTDIKPKQPTNWSKIKDLFL